MEIRLSFTKELGCNLIFIFRDEDSSSLTSLSDDGMVMNNMDAMGAKHSQGGQLPDSNQINDVNENDDSSEL